MYDELDLWLALVRKYISEEAFVFDGEVYVNASPINHIHYKLFDPVVVMSWMNMSTHLLADAADVAVRDEPVNIARAFCIALYEEGKAFEEFEKNLTPVQKEMTHKAVQLIMAAIGDFFVIEQPKQRPKPVQEVAVAEATPKQSAVFQTGSFLP